MKVRFREFAFLSLCAAAWTVGGGFARVAGLTASDGAAGDLFGNSVAVSVNLVIAGAPRKDIGVNSNQGAAYIYRGDIFGNGAFTENVQLRASDGAAEDLLSHDRVGVAISSVSNIAVVSGTRDDVGANIDQGTAYVFRNISTGRMSSLRI